MDVQAAVREFHEAFDLPIGDRPGLRHDLRALRKSLLAEEFEEYVWAEENGNLTGVADALADVVYVAFGTALTYGIDLNGVLDAVHRSNMSKLGPDGRPVLREDGKVMKGEGYFPPDLDALLATEGGR